MMSALFFHCFKICDLHLFFLDLNFFIFSKKNLIDFCSSLKKILSLKFETWNLELKIWTWKFEIWNWKFWNLELKIWNLGLKIWNLALRVWDIFSRIMVSLSLVISKKISSKSQFFFLNWYFLKLWKIFIHPFLFFFFSKRKKGKKEFFLGVDWVNSIKPKLTQQLRLKKERGSNFGPYSLSSPLFFFFAFLSSFFLLPSLSLFTSFFHLDFLLHYTISSLKNTFLNFSTFLHSSPLISFKSLCSWPFLLFTHFVNPISKLPFSLH